MQPLGPESKADVVSDREVAFARTINASLGAVWAAWSELKHLEEWWGPAGFTTTTDEFAFVPGGTWRFTMHSPDGTNYPNRIVFREIITRSRIVYENWWDHSAAPLSFMGVVSFAANSTNTMLTLALTFPSAEAFKTAVDWYGVIPGGTETFERLARYLEQDHI